MNTISTVTDQIQLGPVPEMYSLPKQQHRPDYKDLQRASIYLVRVAYNKDQPIHQAVLFTQLGEDRAKIYCAEYERGVDYKCAYYLFIEKQL